MALVPNCWVGRVRARRAAIASELETGSSELGATADAKNPRYCVKKDRESDVMLPNRSAQCQCGLVTIGCEGEPVRVSACHCFDCQKRSGSAFATQARFKSTQVEIAGETRCFIRVGDSGTEISQYFCPTCGTGMYYQLASEPELLAVAVGLFSDLEFPAPQFSMWEKRKHHWVQIVGGDVQHRAD
jgi:hypothetical protein